MIRALRRLWTACRRSRPAPLPDREQLVRIDSLPYPVTREAAFLFELGAERRRPPRNTWRADIGPALRQSVFPADRAG